MTPDEREAQEREDRILLDKALLGLSLLIGVMLAHWWGWVS